MFIKHKLWMVWYPSNWWNLSWSWLQINVSFYRWWKYSMDFKFNWKRNKFSMNRSFFTLIFHFIHLQFLFITRFVLMSVLHKLVIHSRGVQHVPLPLPIVDFVNHHHLYLVCRWTGQLEKNFASKNGKEFGTTQLVQTIQTVICLNNLHLVDIGKHVLNIIIQIVALILYASWKKKKNFKIWFFFFN